ncbi:MAG: transcription antitermination factor NusB [Planctomycetota bacterium]|nr:transcription antitermination factor NusB [Planctomycetota bacterium]
MATPRDIRRLAFQAMYQLDVRGELEAPFVQESLAGLADEDPAEFSDAEVRKAFELATLAFRARREADLAIAELAPGWPAHRQPSVDRAIIRLAHYEMTSGRTSPKIVVNEAVELAKRFSTDRSPAFVNGVLDKILKRVLAAAPATGPVPSANEPTTPGEN